MPPNIQAAIFLLATGPPEANQERSHWIQMGVDGLVDLGIGGIPAVVLLICAMVCWTISGISKNQLRRAELKAMKGKS